MGPSADAQDEDKANANALHSDRAGQFSWRQTDEQTVLSGFRVRKGVIRHTSDTEYGFSALAHGLAHEEQEQAQRGPLRRAHSVYVHPKNNVHFDEAGGVIFGQQSSDELPSVSVHRFPKRRIWQSNFESEASTAIYCNAESAAQPEVPYKPINKPVDATSFYGTAGLRRGAESPRGRRAVSEEHARPAPRPF
jgi:hypothetical protein